MLAVVLFVLKLMGILLLVIVSVIVAVLLILLFVPIRYKSQGYKQEEIYDIVALVTYLNPIIRVYVHYPDQQIIKVKILGFSIYPAKEKVIKKEQQAVSDLAEKIEPIVPKEEILHEASEEEMQKINSVIITETNEETQKIENQEQETFAKESGNKQSKKTKSKENSTESRAIDSIKYYIALYQENQALILDVIKTILRAFKTILPRKCEMDVKLGTGQADVTGYIYGAYCSLKDSLPGNVYLEPIWTEAHIEGRYYLKGHIRLINFLVAIIKIVVNKDVRLLIKKLRRK